MAETTKIDRLLPRRILISCARYGTSALQLHFPVQVSTLRGSDIMGRGILLWLLGVPIPVILLLALIWR
jgi:hypothetical protein